MLTIALLIVMHLYGAALMYSYTPLARFASRAMGQRWLYWFMILTWEYQATYMLLCRKR
jgi:hypothetical protein